VLAVLVTLAAACGDDDTADGPTTIEVTTVDYAFEGLPATAKAGSTFTLNNTSPTELHEFVAFRIPDDETRPMTELVTLPEEELGVIFAGEPATVLLAAPGGETIPAVGDGTLNETGRYAVVCAIPQGADPQEFLDAAAASEGEPPEVAGGPPHFVLGMYAEITIE
jgi:hypothetical protein